MGKKLKGMLAVLLLTALLLPVAALGTSDCGGSHSWSEWNIAEEPSCTSNGAKTKWCTVCGEKDSAEIPALGHDFGSWEVVRESTCTEAGVRSRTCSRCGFAEVEPVPAAGHRIEERITEATCVEAGRKEKYCTVCGAVTNTTVIKATGKHTYGEWTVTEDATCTEKGARTRACSVCGFTQSESIPATGHTWAKRITKEPTCGDSGKEEKYCTACGKVMETTAVKPTGRHTYGDWIVTREATCRQNGVRTRTCTVCGHEETENIPRSAAHEYGDWIVTREPTCTAAGLRTKTCVNCGLRQTEGIPKLEHSYGEWTVEKAATCTADGKEKRACKVCGFSQRRVVKKLGHSYTEWEITEEATDHSKGTRTAACDRCGKKQTETFYPEGTLYKGADNPPETVTDLQNALAALGLLKGKISGKYDNATADAVTAAEKNILNMKGDGIAWPKVLVSLGIGGAPGEPNSTGTPDAALLLEVEQVSPPKDCYDVGDTVSFSWTLTNRSAGNTASSVRIYHFNGLKANRKTDVEIACPDPLGPEGKVSGTFDYTVTGKDAQDGQFAVGFIARCKVRNKDTNTNKVWFTCRAAGGSGGEEDGGDADGSGESVRTGELQLAISKKVNCKPKNGCFFVRDEEINYLITVANTSKADVGGVVLTDSLFPGVSIATFSIRAGEIKFFAVSGKVGAADLTDGEIISTVTVSYTGPDDGLRSVSYSVGAPVGLNTGSLYVHKKVVNKPANGQFFVRGETVEYEITVANPTGRTFSDVRLYDELSADLKNPAKKIGAMKPGTVKTYAFEHQTTVFEAKTGMIVSGAYVTCADPKGNGLQDASNLCVAPAGPEETLSVPETGSSAGAARNADPVGKDSGACKISLTGEGKGAAEYDLTVCETHGRTAAESISLAENGGYDLAKALWDSDIGELYAGWIAREDAENARNARDEQDAFRACIQALDSSVLLICDPAEAGAIAVEERMIRCLTLCDELHFAPGARSSSRFAAHTALRDAKAPGECTREITRQADGTVHIRNDQCETHRTTSLLISRLLDSASDDGEKTAVWERAQGYWMIQLNAMYDAWYAAADESLCAAITADRLSFERLVDARKRALADLYPDDPAAAAEATADLIMERTELICRLLHNAGILKD